jgi:ABC-type protease/lipase transport system fused ATPase/permease subunit
MPDLPPPAASGARIAAVVAAAFGFAAAANALMLAVPLYSLQVFSRALPSHNLDTLVFLTLAAVLALTLATLFEVVRGKLLSRAANRLEVGLRPRLMAEAAATRDAGGLADLSETRGFLTKPAFAGLLDMPWTPVYAVAIYAIHPLLFAVTAGCAALLLLLGILSHAAVERRNEEARRLGAEAQRFHEAVSRDGPSIRAAGGLRPAVERWWGAAGAAAAVSADAAERSSSIGAAIRWLRQLLYVATTGVGAYLVISQELSLGGMIATSLLVARAMTPFDIVFGAWGQVVHGVRASRRLAARTRRPPPAPLPAPSAIDGARPVGRVRVENLFHVPPGEGRAAVQGATFALDPGQCLLVLGPNGSGKTALGRMLAGALRPQGGTVRIDGRDPAAFEDDPRPIGYLPEQPVILPGTVGDAIGRFAEDEEAVRAAAEAVGLHDRIAAMPAGYATDLADALPRLGGGGLRRLAIARAICGRPRLLVLDEPLAGLDMHGVEAVRRIVRDAKAAGTTVVAMSLQTALIEVADTIMVLDGGTVTACGPAAQIVAGARRDALPPAEAPRHPRIAP